MKKVLFFVPEFPVISETFIERELALLAERGLVDVLVVCLKPGTGVLSDSLKERVSVVRIQKRHVLRGIMTALKDPANAPFSISDLIIDITSNRNRSLFGKFYQIFKIFGYADVLSHYGAEHLHVHFMSEPSTIILGVSRLTHIPFSISGHARDVFGKSTNRSINSELIEDKVHNAKFVSLCNKRAYAYVRSKCAIEDQDKVILQYHGLDFKKFENIPNIEKPADEFWIYNVGRLVEKKGHVYLIEAFSHLEESYKKVKLIIAGAGELLAEINSQIEKLGLQDKVVLLNSGHGIDNSTALSYMKACDVFALPSVDTSDGDAEGVPNTILEAAYFAKPVVTTDAGSITDIIENNVNGIVVPQRDVTALSTVLSNVYVDYSSFAPLGYKLHETVMERFSLDKTINVLEQNLLS